MRPAIVVASPVEDDRLSPNYELKAGAAAYPVCIASFNALSAQFLSAPDADREVRAFGKLGRHDISRWAVTGGLATEIHRLRRGYEPATRALNDIDFIADSFSGISIPPIRRIRRCCRRSTRRVRCASTCFALAAARWTGRQRWNFPVARCG